MIKFFLNNKEYIVESELQVHAIVQAEAMKGRPVPKKLDVTVTAPSSGYVVIAGGSKQFHGGWRTWAEMYAEIEGMEGDYFKNHSPKEGKEQ
jgi:hypothetical protein